MHMYMCSASVVRQVAHRCRVEPHNALGELVLVHWVEVRPHLARPAHRHPLQLVQPVERAAALETREALRRAQPAVSCPKIAAHLVRAVGGEVEERVRAVGGIEHRGISPVRGEPPPLVQVSRLFRRAEVREVGGVELVDSALAPGELRDGGATHDGEPLAEDFRRVPHLVQCAPVAAVEDPDCRVAVEAPGFKERAGGPECEALSEGVTVVIHRAHDLVR